MIPIRKIIYQVRERNLLRNLYYTYMYILHIKFISYRKEETCLTTPREQLSVYMFNFHYRNRENSRARSCAPRDIEWSRQQRGRGGGGARRSRTAGATIRSRA